MDDFVTQDAHQERPARRDPGLHRQPRRSRASADARLPAASTSPRPGCVPLCGNSIGTDRRFLATYLPEIEEFLHYRSVDVSTLKELARRWHPEAYAAAPKKVAGHRALDDIRESLDELRHYRADAFREFARHPIGCPGARTRLLASRNRSRPPKR